MGKVGSSTVIASLKSVYKHGDRSGSWNVNDLDMSRYSKIISMVRDPIRRNISQLFTEWQEPLGYFPEQYDDSMMRIFKEQFDHDWPLRWFDDWLFPHFGIDVYREPFDKEKAWQIYDDKLLVMRTEDLSWILKDALIDFLNLSPKARKKMDVTHRNIGEISRGEAHGRAYAEFKRNAKFDEQFLNRIYKSKYVQHFYTETEIEWFREMWFE